MFHAQCIPRIAKKQMLPIAQAHEHVFFVRSPHQQRSKSVANAEGAGEENMAILMPKSMRNTLKIPFVVYPSPESP